MKTGKEIITQEDGTVTDQELNRVLGRYLSNNPIVGKSTIFAYAFRLGQQFPYRPHLPAINALSQKMYGCDYSEVHLPTRRAELLEMYLGIERGAEYGMTNAE